MPVRSVPGTASVAAAQDGKLFAPSAERNVDPLCDLLADIAPETGSALEIASGTGQHVVAYARRLPGLIWQPTEVDAARRRARMSGQVDLVQVEIGIERHGAWFL